MSTPTKVPANAGVPRMGRPKRKVDEMEEMPPASQLKAQGQPFKETNAAKSKRIKLAARNLLTTLSTKRISVTNISFVESGIRNGGTFADIAIATFARRTRHGQEGRLAVKKLRFVIDSDMSEEKLLKLFANELRLLDRLFHPNIVRIKGFVEDIKNRIAWLLFRWEDNGNLREFLRSGTWEIPERVSLIIDVANGLKYLHTRQPPVCHGDLKSLNILINSSHRAVITDFGSARVIGDAQELRSTSAFNPAASANYGAGEGSAAEACEGRELKVTVSNTAFTLTGPAWSFRWAAPEVLEGSPPDLASDVWALGWIAWEAITDRYPFEELTSEPQVTMKLIEGYLPSIYTQDQLSQIHMLCGRMQNCWKSNPKERPAATECWQTFRWIPNTIPVIKRGEQSDTRSPALLRQIGEMHRLQNRGDKASEAFERGLAIARATGDRAMVAGLLIRLAENQTVQSKAKEAEANYTEALAIYKSIGAKVGRANALIGLGDIQLDRSRYIEAESSYAEALAICKPDRADLSRGHALLGLGDVQQARSKYTEAESSYAEALAIYKGMGEDLGRANALRRLGEVQRARSKYIEAESSLAEALAIYKNIGDDLGRGNALRELGNVQGARSNYVEAESSFTEALAICKRIGDDLGRAHALDGLGDVQRSRSKYIEAESSYVEALSIYRSIGFDLGRANTLDGLGDLQRARSEYTEAESSYAEALAIYESLGENLGRANALYGLGHVQRARSEYIEAESSYAKAVAIYKGIGNDLGQASALRGLGNVQRARSQYIEAASSYTEALAIFESIGNDRGRVNSYLGLAKVCLHQDRYAEAKALLHNATPIAERLEYRSAIRKSNALLQEVREGERFSKAD